jgi:hypothetical protein
LVLSDRRSRAGKEAGGRISRATTTRHGRLGRVCAWARAIRGSIGNVRGGLGSRRARLERHAFEQNETRPETSAGRRSLATRGWRPALGR